jgi:DNA-binding LacI/PurR family transcriptional regulator
MDISTVLWIYPESVNAMKSFTVEQSVEPKYVWYADYLRRQIHAGELKPGERLPSRSEVRERHHITQPTIERAQAILEREGLIVRRERQGVFVAANPGESVAKNLIEGASRVMTGVIAVITPHEPTVPSDHRQFGWSDFITQGALAACTAHGKHALILHPARLRGEELDYLLENPPLGFVFSGLTNRENIKELLWLLNALRAKSQSVVVYGDEPEFSEIDRVDSNHEQGCYLLTRYLIEQGHKAILPFWPTMQDRMQWLVRRHEGYLRAMREAGLPPLPIRQYPHIHQPDAPDDTPAKFARTARHMAGYLADYLGRERRCDAILSISDGDLYTLAAACKLLGHVPNRDVVLAGYDNIWRDAIERSFLPIQPIATVDKHNWRMGHELIDLLMARTDNTIATSPQKVLVQPELIVPSDEIKANSSLIVGHFDPSFKAVLSA